MIADDLFAGAGGWDLAAEALGIHARGIENMPAARATRDAAGLETVHDDVWTYRPKYTARNGGLELQATGLIASPPCQTFSAAGKGAGRKNLDKVLALVPQVPWLHLAELRDLAEGLGDERTGLVLAPLWFAVHHPYRWLSWEQVPQVLPVWEACADVLRGLGWNVWTGKLYSEQYGVPQTRIRAFLLASRDHEVTPPTPTHSRYYSRTPEKLDPGVEKWVSMAEALGWGMTGRPSPTVTGGGTETGGAEPKLDRYTGRSDWILRSRRDAPSRVEQYGPRENRSLDRPAPTITGESHRWAFEFAGAGQTAVDTAGQRRRSLDEPAHTITGKATAAWCYERPATTVQGDPRLAAPGHRCMTNDCHSSREPESMFAKSVRVTVEEAGVLQSFPADYPWNGGPKDASGKKYLQVGNAVPPLMALHALSAASSSPTSPRRPSA